MNRISSLKPNVTREEAERLFTAGLWNTLRTRLRGGVQKLGDLYIPYRFFQVTVQSVGRRQQTVFAIDAVQGTLDLFEFPAMPEASSLTWVETRNVLPISLGPSENRDRIVAKVRRLVFTQGFFKVRGLAIDAGLIPGEIHVPYWVCFRGTTKRASISVIDAVRRRPEGARLRQMVEEWLRTS
jgi:hypothetical protein